MSNDRERRRECTTHLPAGRPCGAAARRPSFWTATDLILFEDIGPPLRAAHALGVKLVLVTNQSGIARGFFSEFDLARMHAYLAAGLAMAGVTLDGVYYCPHHPDGIVQRYAMRCDCRKPRPGMILRAAAELRIDLVRSWIVGDTLDDVEAGMQAGCGSVLIEAGSVQASGNPLRTPHLVAPTTRRALEIVVEMLAARERAGATSASARPAITTAGRERVPLGRVG
jgi:D-glycero-D-manno-heptose 1,7-bisphosphate phosphatase